MGINCTLYSAPVADFRRWIADFDYELPLAPRRTLDLRKDWDVLGRLLTAGRERRVLRFLDEAGGRCRAGTAAWARRGCSGRRLCGSCATGWRG